MVSVGGAALRGVGTLLYLLDFLCAAGIVGIWSYFIAALVKSDFGVSNKWRAVEGLAGAATIYTIFAVLLTCFLGGKRVFALMGVIFDLLFMGAMIAIAVLVRQGVKSCSGTVDTVFGSGLVSSIVPVKWSPSFGTICKLEKTVFALAVAGAALFLLTALVQFAISAHHQKEKKYGPGPDNDYTSGSGKRRMWSRKTVTTEERFPKDAEAGIIATPVVAYEAPRTNVIRPSHDTTYTETTAVGANHEYGNGTLNKIEQKTERTILPPVVDRSVSRNEVHNAPVEVSGSSGIIGASTTHPHYQVNDHYPEPQTSVYYTAPSADAAFHSEPGAASVTKAIFGHENANTGRHF